MTPEPPVREILQQYRRRLGLDLRACWQAYFEMGGHEDIDTLRRFLDGTADLPPAEIDVVAAAIFDLAPPPRSFIGGATILEDLLDASDSGRAAQILAALTGRLTAGPQPSPGGPVELTTSELAIRSEVTTTIRSLAEAEPGRGAHAWGPLTGSRLRVDQASSPVWEMHPNGEELLVLLSGEARVEVDRVDTETILLQRPYQAYVIPQGRWHRHQATQANTKIMFLTPVRPDL